MSRAFLLLALLFALVAGPANPRAICAAKALTADCSCCSALVLTCCEGPSEPLAKAPPAQSASFHLKLDVSPAIVLLGYAPLPELEQSARDQQVDADGARQPLFERICIRLI